MDQWLYRRVLAFYIWEKPKQDREGWWLEADQTHISHELLPGMVRSARGGKSLPLNPQREWGDRAGWLAWDQDFEYADSLDDVLSSLGKHGWELVAVQSAIEFGTPASYYLFKKPFDHDLVEAIEEGLAAADAGDLIDHEEVKARMRAWLGYGGQDQP